METSANRVSFGQTNGSTWVEPPLVIRAAGGTVHPEYAVVKLAIGFHP